MSITVYPDTSVVPECINESLDMEQYFETFLGKVGSHLDGHPTIQVIIVTLPNKQHKNFNLDKRQEIINYAKQAMKNQNIYINMTLQNTALNNSIKKARSAEGAVCMPGLWVDVDFRSDSNAHKAQNLPTYDEYLEFQSELGLIPTMIVNSGNGVHPYLLFSEPLYLNNDVDRLFAAKLSEDFQLWLRNAMAVKGWKLDSTADLARILRVPGTFNHKKVPPKPVQLQTCRPQIRYDVKALRITLDLLLQAQSETIEGNKVGPIDVPAIPKVLKSNKTKPSSSSSKSKIDCSANLDLITKECAWLKYCEQNAKTLPEPDWYHSATILALCVNGEEYFHQWSSNNANYDKNEAHEKFRHAKSSPGPATCEFVERDLAFKGCSNCKHKECIKSPIELGNIKKHLMMDSKERLLPFQVNIEIILEHHPDLAGSISMSEFSYQILKKRQMPWGGGSGDPWTDRDDAEFKSWIETNFWWSPKENLIQGALLAVAHRNPSHCVREFLTGLCWDGVPRLGTWLTTYLGVKDEPYSRVASRVSLVQGVARIFIPGCKADHILILEGPQGLRKSTAIRSLVPCPDWFEDGMPDFRNKDGLMAMSGKWLIEFQELDALSKAEASHIKAFLTDQEDTFRAPYGRRVQTHKRQCIFFGSTNEKTYLQDSSGNRRFLPVECTRIDIDALTRDRDQLWAEAVYEFHQGKLWHLTEIESSLARESQELRRIEDPWESIIGKYLKDKSDVTLIEVMKNGLDLMHQNCKSSEAYRVSRILSGVFNWRKTKVSRTELGKEARVNGFVSNPYQPL